jgi:hypothetical protein
MEKNGKKNIVGSVVLMVLAMYGTRFAQTTGSGQTSQSPVEVVQINASRYSELAKWLDEKAMSPVAYCIAKCNEHQVVIIGEPHNKKEYLELFKKLVIEAYRQAGVRVIGLECCNAEDNGKITRLEDGERYDTSLAYEIARSENWALWGYKEYWDVLKAVWELNKSLPLGSEHMRVVGLDKTMDYQLFTLWQAGQLKDPALIEKAKSQPNVLDRDNWLAGNVEKEILDKGQKGLILIGFNHSFTHYGQPRFDKTRKEMIGRWSRMGVLLYQKYGEKVFQIGLHLEYEPSMIMREGDKGGDPVFTSFLERIMAVHGNKPVGFDVPGSPFADLRDARSYYFYWQPKVTFADLCQGYIFLKPFKALSPCSWMKNFINDEMFKKGRTYYEYAYKRKFKNSQEVNEFFASGKPEI